MEDEDQAAIREQEVDVQAARSRAITWAATEQEEFSALRRRLEELLLDGCIFCSRNKLNDTTHSGLEYKRALEIGREVAEAFLLAGRISRFFRQGYMIEKFGCCMGYFMPQELCDNWEEDGTGGWQRKEGGKCQYKGIVLSILAWVRTCSPEDSIRLYSQLGFVGQEG